HQPADASSSAAQAWSDVKETHDPAVLRSFVSHFDGTFYADLAKSRLNDLAKLASASSSSATALAAGVASKAQAAEDSTGPASKTIAKPDSAASQGASAIGPSDIVGEWRWTARCGLLGNWDGSLKVTSASNGSFSGIISDPLHGTQRISDGEYRDNHFSFTRTRPLETQYAHGVVRRAGSGFRISGSFTNKVMGCPVSGGKA